MNNTDKIKAAAAANKAAVFIDSGNFIEDFIDFTYLIFLTCKTEDISVEKAIKLVADFSN